jgi:hypothetical protein
VTDDLGAGTRWTIDLWPSDAIVLYDWAGDRGFRPDPVEHRARKQALADLLTVLETQVPVAGVTQAQIDKAQDEVSDHELAVPPEMTAAAPALAARRDGARRGNHTAAATMTSPRSAAATPSKWPPGSRPATGRGMRPGCPPDGADDLAPRAGVLPTDHSARSGQPDVSSGTATRAGLPPRTVRVSHRHEATLGASRIQRELLGLGIRAHNRGREQAEPSADLGPGPPADFGLG